jgi:hypothetical protein
MDSNYYVFIIIENEIDWNYYVFIIVVIEIDPNYYVLVHIFHCIGMDIWLQKTKKHMLSQTQSPDGKMWLLRQCGFTSDFFTIDCIRATLVSLLYYQVHVRLVDQLDCVSWIPFQLNLMIMILSHCQTIENRLHISVSWHYSGRIY